MTKTFFGHAGQVFAGAGDGQLDEHGGDGRQNGQQQLTDHPQAAAVPFIIFLTNFKQNSMQP